MMIHFWMYGSSIIKVLQQIKKTSPYGVTCLMTGCCGEGLKGAPSPPPPEGKGETHPSWRPTPALPA